MKVLVTGGCGFIGRYVVEKLHSLGVNTIRLDRSIHTPVSGNVFFGDVRDEGAVRQAMYGCDGFIHLAGVLGTQETVQDPVSASEVNVFGSLNVFKAARDFHVPGVYIGVGNYWMNNPYSITKTTAERFALMANKEWGTHIAVVRALNAYGPRQKWEPVRKLMPNLVRSALAGEPFTVYGNGEQIMDMIYVSDVAEVLVAALLHDHGVYEEAFEAGSGKATTVLDVVREVYKQVGTKEFSEIIDFRPMRPGEDEDAVVLADTDLLRKLDIDPHGFVDLSHGVKRTIDWYRFNS